MLFRMGGTEKVGKTVKRAVEDRRLFLCFSSQNLGNCGNLPVES